MNSILEEQKRAKVNGVLESSPNKKVTSPLQSTTPNSARVMGANNILYDEQGGQKKEPVLNNIGAISDGDIDSPAPTAALPLVENVDGGNSPNGKEPIAQRKRRSSSIKKAASH